MAKKPRNRTAWRTLTALGVLIAVVFGGLTAASIWGNPRAEWTPSLGLDLAGGRQIIIEPRTETGSISGDQINQAIDIIRNRVDGQGVSEAEVSQLGSSNIAVSIPGNPTAAQMDSLSRSSQLQFRAVLQAGTAVPTVRSIPLPDWFVPLNQVDTGDDAESTSSPDDAESTSAPDDAESTSSPDDTQTTEAPSEGVYPEGLLSSDVSAADGAATDAPDSESETDAPTQAPAEPEAPAVDPFTVTPELQLEFQNLDCFNPAASQAAAEAPADQPIVACSQNGVERYILGPVELDGSNIDNADAAFQTSQAGVSTGQIEVQLTLDSEGATLFRDITERLYQYNIQGTTGVSADNRARFAMVLDGQVISAPTVQGIIREGIAQITGGFTMEEAQELANQLNFGALPMSFEIQTSEQISPTLGGEQLRYGLLAGVIGLLLVFAFMLVQYRALGLVTVATLVVAGVLTYGVVTFLGWSHNMRLTMAGITGLIMAIAIIADSFIVYFERIKDEVRAGRPLRYAVDTGWARARRTILISDAVNLVVAAVLYFLSDSSVAAFAFALGLITVIDLIVVFMFTHPVVSILANTRFFGEGHQWSGMSPERLGAKRSAYLGRGQIRPPEPARKPRHSREELEGGIV